MSTDNVNNYYMGSFIGSFVGGLLLLLFDFGGWYYYNAYLGVRVWEYYGIFYDAGSFILIGGTSAALFYVAYLSYNATKSPPTDDNVAVMYKISLTAMIIIGVGGIVFLIATSIDNDDWWLDTGFFGGLIGSVISTISLRAAKNA